jgi:hypothetical protein
MISLNMKKWWLVLLLGIIIVLVISSIFLIPVYQEEEKIKEYRIIEHEFLKCLNGCPIVQNEQFGGVYEDTCYHNCKAGLDVISPEDLDNYHDKLLRGSAEHEPCNQLLYEEYQSCLRNVLPLWEEKYNYLTAD